MEITAGLQGIASTTVDNTNTARAVGSGSLEVFATPMMVALMEQAAVTAIERVLEEGQTTVGTALDISHSAATPVGQTVTATATVTVVDRRRIDFNITASDERGEIGLGTHSRFVVDAESFQKKTDEK